MKQSHRNYTKFTYILFACTQTFLSSAGQTSVTIHQSVSIDCLSSKVDDRFRYHTFTKPILIFMEYYGQYLQVVQEVPVEERRMEMRWLGKFNNRKQVCHLHEASCR